MRDILLKKTVALGAAATALLAVYQPVAADLFNDVWEYDIKKQRWTELTPGGTPPTPNHGYRAHYDSVHQRLVTNADGGMALSLVDGEEEWSSLSLPSGSCVGLNFDTDSGRTYLPLNSGLLYWNTYDGSSGSLTMNNWDWTGREGTFHYDPPRNRLLDFGLRRLISYTFSSDETSVTALRITQTGDIPATSDFHGAVIDPVAEKLIVFGGNANDYAVYPDYEGSTYELDLKTDTWQLIEPPVSPPARGQFSTAWDPVNRQWYILCGLYRTEEGFSSVVTYNEVWVYDSPTQSWQEVAVKGEKPRTRRQPTTIYDELNERIILFGGEEVNGPPPSGARIKIPKDGKKISGNRVTIMAELQYGEPSDTADVRFQYRSPSITGSWVDVIPANGNQTNPDDSHPYFVHWDVTGFSNGEVDLRAVAKSDGNFIDPSPEYITVSIDHANPNTVENEAAGVHTLMSSTSEGFGALGSVNSNGTGFSNIRINYLTETFTDSETLKITHSDPFEFEVFGYTVVGAPVKIEYSGTSTGQPFEVVMTYTDDDANNVVDGTSVLVSDLRIKSMEAERGATETVESTLDTDKREVSATFNSLGTFALIENDDTSVHFEDWILY